MRISGGSKPPPYGRSAAAASGRPTERRKRAGRVSGPYDFMRYDASTFVGDGVLDVPIVAAASGRPTDMRKHKSIRIVGDGVLDVPSVMNTPLSEAAGASPRPTEGLPRQAAPALRIWGNVNLCES